MDSKQYILIVDDDPDARTILNKILDTLGFPAQSAADGQEALDKIAAQQPALILLDLMMPGMNGFEFLFRKMAVPQTRYIPVIVVSAVSNEDTLKLPGVSRVIRKAGMRVADVRDAVVSLVGTYPHA